jgi:hypothetical protein
MFDLIDRKISDENHFQYQNKIVQYQLIHFSMHSLTKASKLRNNLNVSIGVI